MTPITSTSLKRPRTRERVERCTQLIQEGKRRKEIIPILTEEFKVSPRRVDDYLQMAYKLLADEAARERQKEVGRSLARLNYVYEQAVERGSLQIAILAVREINTLLGLNAPSRFQLDAQLNLDWRSAVLQAWEEVRADAQPQPALAG